MVSGQGTRAESQSKPWSSSTQAAIAAHEEHETSSEGMWSVPSCRAWLTSAERRSHRTDPAAHERGSPQTATMPHGTR